jgi:hypothetical protein
MNDYPAIFDALTRDERYQANLDWGKPRRGHPEGTVRAHIAELEQNLEHFRPRLSDEDYWKLRILIHTHDTFKGEAISGVAISHPQSHASLARAFLAEFCHDEDLLTMVQLHDEPFALFKQQQHRVRFDQQRFAGLLKAIRDWNLFSAFLLIDGCTAGKERRPLQWFFGQIKGRVESTFGAEDIL